MQKPHIPTLIIVLIIVLALIGIYHVSLGRRR